MLRFGIVSAGSLKLLAAALLALGIGVQLLEMSGRWDRTFQDANDEAGIVAIVLCVGVAFAVAGVSLARVRQARGSTYSVRVSHRIDDSTFGFSLVPVHTSSPLTRLRI
jgi:hypothetical protein